MSRRDAEGRDALAPYLDEVGPCPRLSAEEERRLAERVSRGDPEARDRLVQANLRLVASIARDFRGRGVATEDLVAEGNLGLIRAVEGVRRRLRRELRHLRGVLDQAVDACPDPAGGWPGAAAMVHGDADAEVVPGRGGPGPGDGPSPLGAEVARAAGADPRQVPMVAAAREARAMESIYEAASPEGCRPGYPSLTVGCPVRSAGGGGRSGVAAFPHGGPGRPLDDDHPPAFRARRAPR